jgi:type IV pilus assembly protein PilE
MTTRSSGFTLIELLVVVAIIGILSAIGTITYQGYVSATKQKSTENVMQQIALLQTEYLSNTGDYFYSTPVGTASSNADALDACTPTTLSSYPDEGGTDGTSEELEKGMFDGGDIVTKEMGYWICVAKYGEPGAETSFIIVAEEAHDDSAKVPPTPCKMSMTANINWVRNANC